MSKKIAGAGASLSNLFIYSTLSSAILCSISGVQAEQLEQDNIEVIEVRGILASNAKNLSIKRMSTAVVDAITAEDVGKFPDKNVADSLQRVPGVTVERNGGEGSRVSIRGTSSDWTLTQLNGNYIASSDNGAPSRSFNYAMLPSSMISRAEVYKSPEARLDEGGVGGTVILYTRKPLDMDSGEGAISFETTYSDTNETFEPQFNALYSWKNDAETFGILASYTKQDRTVVSIKNSAGGWRYHSDTDEGASRPAIVDQADPSKVYNNVWAPTGMSTSNNQEDRTRDGYQIAVQWQFSDNLELSFNYFGTKYGYNEMQQSLTFAEWNDNHNAYYGVELDGDTVIAFGQADNGLLNDDNWGDADVNGGVAVRRGLLSPQLTGRSLEGESRSDTYDFSAIYEGDYYTASVNFGRTDAKGGTSNNTMANIDARNGSVNSWLWSTASGKPSYEVDVDLSADRNAYQYFDWFNSSSSENSDREDYLKLDFEIEVDLGIISAIHTGFKYRNHKIVGTRTDFKWDDDISDNGGYRGWLDGSEWFHNPDYHPDASSLLGQGSLDNSAGDTGAIDFIPFDFAALDDYVSNNFTRTAVPVLSGSYQIDERIFATYVQADYSWTQLRGNFGVRVVRTEQDILTYDDIIGQSNDITVANVRDSVNINVLPSLNVAWDFSDTLVGRFAAAQTMSRVSYADLSRAESYGPPVNINSADSWTGYGSGTAASYDLEAMTANQYDLGLEWYYSEGSAMGLMLFRKDIENLPIESSEIVTREHDCCNGPIEVEMSTKVNGGKATSQGVEVFVQHSFESGFGLMVNYTFTDTSTSSVTTNGETTNADIPGTARNQYNVSTFYENDDFGVRASYNWKDKRASSIHQGFNNYDAAYGQLDVNGTYNINESFAIIASVINLTEEVEKGYWKQENRFTYNSYSGRRFYLGANYKF